MRHHPLQPTAEAFQMAKKKPVKRVKNEVRFSTTGQGIMLPKNGIEFEAKHGKSKIGELKVSHGSVSWKPLNSQTWITVTWQKLGKMFVPEE